MCAHTNKASDQNPNSYQMPAHSPNTRREELCETVIPMFIQANTRAHRYTVLLTAERTGRKPNTGAATTKQAGQHLQWWGQGSEQQRLCSHHQAIHPLILLTWARASVLSKKKKLPPRWWCLSHTSTHYTHTMANCHCYTKSHWSLC